MNRPIAVLNPHSNMIKAGKVTRGTGLNGQQQPVAVSNRVIYNPLSNKRKQEPVR